MKNVIDTELTKEFKDNLRKLLEERKGETNPKRLSKDAGLGETAIRDILQDRSSSPRLETIQKIAKALNVPVYRLIPSMIDQSYAQLAQQAEEIKILKEASGLDYESLQDLKNKTK